ncbi:MAG: hypothetical protein AB7G28_22715 [Pirellulales bacterium]
MAKRRDKDAVKTVPASTGDLAGDARNPRFISPAASTGLGKSLDEFGDLSGIVWNRRTGQLVCGHQRLEQIHAKWGPQPIVIVDADRELGAIKIDDAHCFTVRVVDWPAEKQAAANVTANNPKIAGEFTADVVDFLESANLASAMPGILDDVLLTDLLAEFADAGPTELTKVDVKPPPAMTWVLVAISTPRFGRIAGLIDELAQVPDVTIESTLNDG